MVDLWERGDVCCHEVAKVHKSTTFVKKEANCITFQHTASIGGGNGALGWWVARYHIALWGCGVLWWWIGRRAEHVLGGCVGRLGVA